MKSWITALAAGFFAIGCGRVEPNPTGHDAAISDAAEPDAAGPECTLDDDCASGVCRQDGACVDSSDVLYVSPTGISAGECTNASPCELLYARSKVTAQRAFIRVANGTYSLPGAFAVTSPIGTIAIIGGRNAVFERSTTGPSFSVGTGSTLTIRGVSLHRGLECDTGTLHLARVGFSSPGAETRPWVSSSNCTTTIDEAELDGAPDYAIDATNGGALTVTGTKISGGSSGGIRKLNGQLTVNKSVIFQNAGIGVTTTAQEVVIRRSSFFENRLGGVSSTGGVFDVTNNFVYRNGNAATATFGGLLLDTNNPGNRFEHNTVVHNDCDVSAMPVYAGGVFCRGGGTSANNVITNNYRGNTSLANAQTGGTCTFTGSLVVELHDTVHFVRPEAVPFDYHLADAQSAAVNAGIVSTPAVTDDFDGDTRDDGMPDIGADEL